MSENPESLLSPEDVTNFISKFKDGASHIILEKFSGEFSYDFAFMLYRRTPDSELVMIRTDIPEKKSLVALEFRKRFFTINGEVSTKDITSYRHLNALGIL